MERDKLFGMPLWLVVVALGGAGVIGYLLFFRNSGSSSSDTGTTGYSSQGLAVMQNPDESATMALQNQELSVLANDVSTGFGGLSGQVSQVSGQVSDVANQVGNLGTSLSTSAEILSQQNIGLGSQIANLQNSTNASASANSAYYQSLLTNLQNYANSLSSQVAAGDSSAQQQLTDVQNSINQLGAFSGWQFYQIPNRYQATIPAGLNPPGWSG